uniref:TGF-beta family profile domain-containing protein n=1 Tax=Electrophorus electricus TaxID=8005 RepID=A0AAY5EM36_ELEEL
MQPAGSTYPQTPAGSASLVPTSSPSPSPSLSSSSSSSSPPLPSLLRTRGLRRVERATEVSYLFQSFTEGKVQRVIGTLVERQGVSASRRGRRTRRARKEPRACSLHEVQLTVTELGLGYDSDETVSFRYCSGWCDGRRRNYDLVMEHVRLGEASRRRAGRRGRAKAEPAHHGPCCRPIKYEKKMSFFDNNERFFTIKNVSAKECGCV